MKKYLSLVKFAHTIFALPFALLGFFLAVNLPGIEFEWYLLLMVLLCMVFARSAAMAFNRYLDRDIDKLNPRTSVREVPAGIISPKAAITFVFINSLLFIGCTYFINQLVFFLSPIALLVILGYSYTKRFTWLCHYVLGLGLALAPIGAYLATGGQFDLIPLLYSGAVFFWVAGFDIIYALQDEKFDKSNQLKSIPVKLGVSNALMLSNISHLLSAALIITAAFLLPQTYAGLDYIHWIGALLFIGLLFYQHRLVSPTDLSKVNLAFFTTNGIASLSFAVLVILDFYI